ncbi:uncharacterized protein PV07_06273 [Cladophialophora immunda]|uniref:Uncharacterized protein n=1 Tax=Cladophialophora immunda TaxID=569365 RepID=A0A0D2D4F0_9EURO|nr:uncharacterized protein PV07_06273 [Cladophialophora immunda]KIW30534.1 hypothetical protein PV07_06273 [Cladophialophora immunda]
MDPLLLVDINRIGLEDTQQLVKEASGTAEVHLHVADVSLAAEVELMVKTCVAVFGRIDFAMNNTGIAQGGKKTADTPIEMFDRLANVNVKGCFYTSTKHAVLVLTRVDARQFAPHQIRVNSICPGFVPTPLMSGAGMPDSFYEAVKLESPQNRMTAPEEIAEGVVFLSESRAAGITGINLSVDSGAALYHAY